MDKLYGYVNVIVEIQQKFVVMILDLVILALVVVNVIILMAKIKLVKYYNANISFIKEKTFESCRFLDTNQLARFDFYLPDYNLLIEYDGRQHFIQGNGNYDNIDKFQQTQLRDLFKNDWCKEHNIPLIRIPYTHYESLTLEDLLPSSKFII